jgi:hypothetical protein
LDENSYYTFNARYYQTKANIAVHGNTFLVLKDLFFKAGGYDEDFTGNHGYTDVLMLLNLGKVATHVHLNNLYIEAVLNGSIHTLERNESINRELFKKKIRDKEEKPSNLMRFPWRKVEF